MNEIKFMLKTDRAKKDLEELLNDLQYFGVLKRKIEKTKNGFSVTFDREEWKNSWESVGFYGTNYAEMFQEELEGQEFEAIVTEEQP